MIKLASKKTFYIVSDNIQTKSKDKARIRAIADAFRSIGHKAVVGDVGSNMHTKPKKYGCTKKNDVWVCIFGGACAGTIADMTGYTGFGEWFKKDQLKKAHLMYIFVSNPEGNAVDIANTKKLGIAHDDNFSRKVKNFTGIKNPSNYLLKHDVTWLEDGTTSAIVQKIKQQKFNGQGLDLDGTGQTGEKQITNSYTISRGYDVNTPFEAYLKIDYAVGKANGEVKTIYVDWSSEAPSRYNKFDNTYPLQWQNRKNNIHEIDLLSKIKTAERDYAETSTKKYYLKKVTFLRDFQDKIDDIDTEEDESLAYDDKDKSSYKMAIYDLGVFNGEVVKMESLGVSGKTLLDGMKGILEKANYNFNIIYGARRDMDIINFSENITQSPIRYTFNEGFDGNIIGISNVKYSPTSQLVNSSVVIYKSKKKENDPTMTYNYSKKCKMEEVLRYGEQMKVENLSTETGSREATQKSYDNLLEYFQPVTTFTVKSVGLPPVKIHDLVETKTINPLLTNEYEVKSRKINIDVTDRPMVQTEFGLGDIDAPLKVKRNLAEQRKKLVRKQIDVNQPVVYEDSMTDEFINSVWVD